MEDHQFPKTEKAKNRTFGHVNASFLNVIATFSHIIKSAPVRLYPYQRNMSSLSLFAFCFKILLLKNSARMHVTKLLS